MSEPGKEKKKRRSSRAASPVSQCARCSIRGTGWEKKRTGGENCSVPNCMFLTLCLDDRAGRERREKEWLHRWPVFLIYWFEQGEKGACVGIKHLIIFLLNLREKKKEREKEGGESKMKLLRHCTTQGKGERGGKRTYSC